MGYSKRALWGLVVFGALIAYWAISGDEKKDPTPATRVEAPKPAMRQEPPPSVSPEAVRELNAMKPTAVDNRKIFDDYSSNEVAADKKYNGQLLEITSILHSVEKDDGGGIVLRLATRNQFVQSYAALDSARAEGDDRIVKLARGDKIVVTCVGVGLTAGIPVFGGCVLQKAFRRQPE